VIHVTLFESVFIFIITVIELNFGYICACVFVDDMCVVILLINKAK
jgi:hypothetical protein